MTWTWNPDALSAALSAAGFDVDRTNASPIGGGSLTARRNRAERADLIAVDAGGRFRATLTRQAAAPESTSTMLDGVTVHVLTEDTRTTTIAGQLTAPDQFQTLLSRLETLAAGSPHLGDEPSIAGI